MFFKNFRRTQLGDLQHPAGVRTKDGKLTVPVREMRRIDFEADWTQIDPFGEARGTELDTPAHLTRRRDAGNRVLAELPGIHDGASNPNRERFPQRKIEAEG